jgi:uncharacterized protein
VALFGVLVGNLSELLLGGYAANREQLSLLPTAELDRVTGAWIGFLVTDKANTLFYLVFGVGACLQLNRLKQQGGQYRLIYLRRMAALSVIALVNLVFLFPLDILHVYVFAGLVLLAANDLSDRQILSIGLVLTFFGQPAVNYLVSLSGLVDLQRALLYFGEESVLQQQAKVERWQYFEWVRHFISVNAASWFLNGAFLGVACYMLGRVFIGAWIGRKQWLTEAGSYRSAYRRVLFLCLPVGVLLEVTAQISDVGRNFRELLQLTATPVVALSYLCLITLGLRMKFWSKPLHCFAPVGRMALSNYVLGGVLSMAFLFGPAGLAGSVGLTHCVLFAVLVFAVQAIASATWLRFFTMGPLEWAWRGMTYGRLPPLKRQRALAG